MYTLKFNVLVTNCYLPLKMWLSKQITYFSKFFNQIFTQVHFVQEHVRLQIGGEWCLPRAAKFPCLSINSRVVTLTKISLLCKKKKRFVFLTLWRNHLLSPQCFKHGTISTQYTSVASTGHPFWNDRDGRQYSRCFGQKQKPNLCPADMYHAHTEISSAYSSSYVCMTRTDVFSHSDSHRKDTCFSGSRHF